MNIKIQEEIDKDEKVEINLRDDIELLRKFGKKKLAEVKQILQDEKSTWVLCPKLQKNFSYWMSGGAFTVL